RDKRRVTAELDGVAEALLGMEENDLAPDRIRSEPRWLREIALGVFQLRGLPAPLVLLPAALEVPQEQPAHRLIVVCVGKVGTQRLRPAVARQRFVVALEIM